MILRVFILLTATVLSHCQDAAVLQAPVNVSAPLGTNVSFNCSVRNASVVWAVNNHELTAEQVVSAANEKEIYLLPSSTTNGVTSSSLIVLAWAITNITELSYSCKAYSGIGIDPILSEPVYLTVFGKPLAPTQASLSANNLHQLTLSWGPPFTHAGEVLSYTVLMRNLNTSSTELLEGLTTTSYTHSLTQEQATLCQTYQFTVFSNNAVGLSESNTTAQGVHPSAPGAVLINEPIISLSPELSVTLLFETPCTCLPLTYFVILEVDSEKLTKGPFLPYSGTGMDRIILTDLKENKPYTVTVIAQYKPDIFSVSDNITIYTTDVQSASVEHLINGSLLLKCLFGKGSLAIGCQLTIGLIPQEVTISIRVYKINTSSSEATYLYEGGMPVGSHLSFIVAEDIEDNGLLGEYALKGKIYSLPSAAQEATNSLIPTPSISVSRGLSTDTLNPTHTMNSTLNLSPVKSNDAKTVQSDGIPKGFITITAVASAALILALSIFILIFCWVIKRWRRKNNCSTFGLSPVLPIYEEVDMAINHRYDSGKAAEGSLQMAFSHQNGEIQNPLYSSSDRKLANETNNAGVLEYDYIQCEKSLVSLQGCSEPYETMKPGVTVRVDIATVGSVCLTSRDPN